MIAKAVTNNRLENLTLKDLSGWLGNIDPIRPVSPAAQRSQHVTRSATDIHIYPHQRARRRPLPQDFERSSACGGKESALFSRRTGWANGVHRQRSSETFRIGCAYIASVSVAR